MPARRAHAPPTLEAGARLGGKYRLLGRIAVGGMGEVWRARNESTEAEVAVKVSRSGIADSLDGRFRREARLASSLSHRNVVRIFDLVEGDDGSFLLVMELLRGASLARYLEARTRLSTREAVAIAVPILAGLGHVHERGIVHRDVTPANVFLAVDPDGQVTPKLIDFGIAKLPATDTHTLEGRVLGTPRYMAPEQIRGQMLDGRADLFSLAVVLYEAISGVGPFDAGSPSASLAAVLEARVDADPLIEPRVWLELQRALAKRPYERHSHAGEMAEALRAACGDNDASLASLLRQMPPLPDERSVAHPGSAAGATVEGQSIEGPRGGRRASRTVWLAVGAVATCGAVVGASMLWGSRAPSSGGSAVTMAPAAASLSSTPSASTTASSAAPDVASAPLPLPGTTAPPANPSSRVVHPHRPKPVGTQPGF
ncbi:MAG TPA: serine/threonine-protein kinase [Polyangiaceae bacterium]